MKISVLTMLSLVFTLLVSAADNSKGNPCKLHGNSGTASSTDTTRLYPEEKHLTNIRQLTKDGDYAEAYFSFDDSMISFQAKSKGWGAMCDQIYMFPFSDGDMIDQMPQLISNGVGRTTCSFFMPGNTSILYASTRSGGDACPPDPERRADGKYLWPIYQDFDIYISNLKGDVIDTLVKNPGYDAEATVSPDGKMIVFTSDRTGDLELYTCNIDGSNIKQVTFGLGYDGGAFFSPDSRKLVFRASRPQTPEAIKEYKDLLKEGLVAPTNMEIYTCNTDGSDLKQITRLGKANWAPFFHPSGKKIIFSSNHAGARGFEFNLYMINIDGSGLERITFDPVFDAFPMFSYDGKKLIFSSNRNNGGTRYTNLFIADWVE
ncbi:MAG: PD40 domain-containing protein [Bacteroidales bacterium]|nr:PD40 domain-containing protein [Bacteroidales bacterium]